jgi:hypothetical protein
MDRGDVKAEVRALLADHAGKEWTDENYNLALQYAVEEAARLTGLTVRQIAATLAPGQNAVVLSDPAIGISSVVMEVLP